MAQTNQETLSRNTSYLGRTFISSAIKPDRNFQLYQLIASNNWPLMCFLNWKDGSHVLLVPEVAQRAFQIEIRPVEMVSHPELLRDKVQKYEAPQEKGLVVLRLHLVLEGHRLVLEETTTGNLFLKCTKAT